MRQNIDFRGNNNPPASISNPKPTFKIVKAGISRQVLAFDTSSSMSGEHLESVKKAATHYILNIVPDGSYLGWLSTE